MRAKLLLAIGLAALMTSSAQASQEQLATSMKETRLEADQTRNQLATTLAALTTLTQQKEGDLRPAYDAFSQELPKTEAAGTATQMRVTWMEGEGMKYFEDWQATISSINDESLRKKSQQRLDAVKKSYTKVTGQFKEAAADFTPFLADISDIQKVLSTDLTAGGIKGLRSTVNKANSDYKKLDRTINDALEEMMDLERQLSPEASAN
jgi:Protein of unknown function (DUF2959)